MKRKPIRQKTKILLIQLIKNNKKVSNKPNKNK